MSPGWQFKCLQMASSGEKRMARALPVLRTERFCGVMSTPSARSFRRILRWARTTSRLTMMGINLNGQFLFLADFPRLVNQPADANNKKSGKQVAPDNFMSNLLQRWNKQ